MKPLPDSVFALIQELETTYPPACKTPNESLEDHMFYAGAADLVSRLRARYEWTQENYRSREILKGT